MQQREQTLHGGALRLAQLALDRQLQPLDEADLLIERVAQRDATAGVQVPGDEAKALKRRGIEHDVRLLGVGGHPQSVEGACSACCSGAL